MTEKIVLTHDAQQRLTDELRWLETTERSNVQKEIEMAKQLGDLSENAEYTAACEYQTRVESRIQAIRQILDHAEIV